MKSTTNISINNPNRNFAIDAAPAAIPVNPKIAAIIAITKNMAAHLSIIDLFKSYFMGARYIPQSIFSLDFR
jgi:hypothetical protein